jgi:hypothetical protein
MSEEEIMQKIGEIVLSISKEKWKCGLRTYEL